MFNMESEKEAAVYGQMVEFVRTGGGYNSWCAALRPEDDLDSMKFLSMKSRPCYGEMRRYGAKSTRRSDPKPGDLPRPIPDKHIREAVGVPFMNGVAKPETSRWEMIEFLLSQDGPFRRGVKGYDKVLDTEGNWRGVILTETDVDPTVMVAMFMYLRYCPAPTKGQTPLEAFLRSLLKILPKSSGFLIQPSQSYAFGNQIDPVRVVSGDSRDLSNGGTWRDQEDYNRPDMPKMFALDNPEDRGLSLKYFLKELDLPMGYVYPKDKEKDAEELFESIIVEALAMPTQTETETETAEAA